ncbi:hypothetical protein OS121_08340 [Mycolicibacterium mucogenicum]|nr:hypothetical protein [Mycolicibacterium mucogenicum]
MDDHFDARWATHRDASARRGHRQRGAAYHLVRYADDFVVLVFGQRGHAEHLWEDMASLLAPMGLRLARPRRRSSISTRASTS